MNEEMIQVLKVEPGKAPEQIELANTLKAMQEVVGGYIEIVCLDEDTCLVCNEEGKLQGLDYNRRLEGDIIAGTFFLVRDDGEGGFCSLSEGQLDVYKERFAQPETFQMEESAYDFRSPFCSM
jgi:hypothetical protein